MRIGQLAAASGLSRDTLRFYEARGLIRSDRRPNGYRSYPEGTLFVLDFIKTARDLGFTLAEIEAELPTLSQTGLSQDHVAKVLQSKIAVVENRISQLIRLRDALNARLEATCPVLSR